MSFLLCPRLGDRDPRRDGGEIRLNNSYWLVHTLPRITSAGGEKHVRGLRTNAPVSPWPDPGARSEARHAKRAAVLASAVRLFNAKGFHATSLDDVADDLNVTKPTTYHYFANKDDILFECVRNGLAAIIEQTSRVAAQGGSGAERLRAMATGYAQVMTQDFGICVTRTSDTELAEPSRARFRPLKREVDQLVRRVVTEGMADGALRSGDARLVTFTLTGALNGIGRWFDPAGEMTVDDVVRGTVTILMTGLDAAEEPR